jgi:hypothetical protein
MKPEEQRPAHDPQPDTNVNDARTERRPWVAPTLHRLDLRDAMAGGPAIPRPDVFTSS